VGQAGGPPGVDGEGAGRAVAALTAGCGWSAVPIPSAGGTGVCGSGPL
jgi:hypothetical protein